MANIKQIKKIVLTGPESTGKTTLTKQLSNIFSSKFYSEFAREYIESLNRNYKFSDVEIIAKKQIELFKKADYDTNKCVFFDTGLIITKIWFSEVYGIIPKYLNDAIKEIKVDLYLLCYPDIKWVADGVRENGGKQRIYLFNRYKKELDKNNFKYLIIKGDKNKRLSLAKEYLHSAYCL